MESFTSLDSYPNSPSFRPIYGQNQTLITANKNDWRAIPLASNGLLATHTLLTMQATRERLCKPFCHLWNNFYRAYRRLLFRSKGMTSRGIYSFSPCNTPKRRRFQVSWLFCAVNKLHIINYYMGIFLKRSLSSRTTTASSFSPHSALTFFPHLQKTDVVDVGKAMSTRSVNRCRRHRFWRQQARTCGEKVLRNRKFFRNFAGKTRVLLLSL
jgi:hypothetical protein